MNLLIRFRNIKSFLEITKNGDRNGVSGQSTHPDMALERVDKCKINVKGVRRILM